MTTAEMTALLRLRRELTGESFNDGTVAAWLQALEGWTPGQTTAALVKAARENKRIAVADLAGRLPPLVLVRHGADRAECELCCGSGWTEADPAQCSIPGVVPCQCSEGRRREDAYRRMVDQRATARR